MICRVPCTLIVVNWNAYPVRCTRQGLYVPMRCGDNVLIIAVHTSPFVLSVSVSGVAKRVLCYDCYIFFFIVVTTADTNSTMRLKRMDLHCNLNWRAEVRVCVLWGIRRYKLAFQVIAQWSLRNSSKKKKKHTMPLLNGTHGASVSAVSR